MAVHNMHEMAQARMAGRVWGVRARWGGGGDDKAEMGGAGIGRAGHSRDGFGTVVLSTHDMARGCVWQGRHGVGWCGLSRTARPWHSN